ISRLKCIWTRKSLTVIKENAPYVGLKPLQSGFHLGSGALYGHYSYATRRLYFDFGRARGHLRLSGRFREYLEISRADRGQWWCGVPANLSLRHTGGGLTRDDRRAHLRPSRACQPYCCFEASGARSAVVA